MTTRQAEAGCFQEESQTNPLLGWMATVPSVDAVQEAKRLRELEEKRMRGIHQELEAYLRAPPVLKTECPLKWWREIGCKAYPNLAKAARDYLAVPATTCTSERAFSEGRQVVDFTRHQLSDKMIQANMCLKSWFEVF